MLTVPSTLLVPANKPFGSVASTFNGVSSVALTISLASMNDVSTVNVNAGLSALSLPAASVKV